MPTTAEKLERMRCPPSLASEDYQPWSGGRGRDVWETLTAAMKGDLDHIRALLEKDPHLLECEFEYHRPLRFAVRENQIPVVRFLLELGANPVHEIGHLPVEIARMRGHAELYALLRAELAARHGILPEAAPVAAAIQSRDLPRVCALLDEDPRLLHAADERGNRPIHWAVMTRQMPLIDLLLERGADIEARRPDGLRPIHLTNGDYHYRGWRDVPAAALRKHEILIGYLLARGARHDLATATRIGDLDRVRLLLDEDPSRIHELPTQSYYVGLPLRNAAGAGHVEVVKFLLSRGADPNHPEPNIAPRGGALHSALSGKHWEVVQILLDHGADPNAQAESSGNCLYMAKLVAAPKEIHDRLVALGAIMGPELADLEALTAMLAANPRLEVPERLDDPAIMRRILHHQPDFLRRDLDPTPWWNRVTPETPDYARWLVEHGFDPNRSNWLGVTPMHRAAAKGSPEVMQVFLDAGGRLDLVDSEFSSTPLGWAAREGRPGMVEWLVARGADPGLPADEPWARPAAWTERRRTEEPAGP